MTRSGIHELTTDEEFRTAYAIVAQLLDLAFEEYRDGLAYQRRRDYRLFGNHDDDGKLVAVAGVAEEYNFASGLHLSVYNLVTEESRRGEGFGTELLEFAHELARSEGYDYVTLESGLWRDQAHEFYESLGYEKFCYSFRKEID